MFHTQAVASALAGMLTPVTSGQIVMAGLASG